MNEADVLSKALLFVLARSSLLASWEDFCLGFLTSFWRISIFLFCTFYLLALRDAPAVVVLKLYINTWLLPRDLVELYCYRRLFMVISELEPFDRALSSAIMFQF